MPWSMRIGAWTSAIVGILGLVIVPLAALNVCSYSIDGQRVSGPHFLIYGYPTVLPFLALTLAIAYGYRTEQMWARTLPIFFWAAVDCLLAWQVFDGDATGNDAIAYGFFAVLYVSVALWFFWFKRSVDLYYRALGASYSRVDELSADAAGA